MINAPSDKEFIFHDGVRAKNFLELVSKLEHMGDHEFHHFVTPHKNDFANWTEHVLHDKIFSEKLRNVHSRNDTIKLLEEKIKELTIGVTLGNSIIKVPRIEDHHVSGESHLVEHHIPEHEIRHEIQHEVQHESQHDVHVHEKHEDNYPDTKHHEDTKHEDIRHEEQTSVIYHKTKTEDVHPKHLLDEVPSIEDIDDKDEKSKESKASRNWFKLFSKKGTTEIKLENIERKEEDKLDAERMLKEEVNQDGRENILWIILYFSLVLLIIVLLVYKLFL